MNSETHYKGNRRRKHGTLWEENRGDRAYVAEGGGADYHDQAEDHWIVKQIATPMSIYPEYKATRTSFGINALKTLVVEVEADNGVTGFGITTGGYPAAWLVMNHLDRFVVGKDASQIEMIWDQMYRASLYYGRKGVVMNAISRSTWRSGICSDI